MRSTSKEEEAGVPGVGGMTDGMYSPGVRLSSLLFSTFSSLDPTDRYLIVVDHVDRRTMSNRFKFFLFREGR